ncbi:flagellar hook-length control protein FliK [Butyrivibrio sp. AC2005]|uniref:flagellar hook-length control protein FliK n=1 Tax=Butyrivibrio sp. AC2005 TaxID=1280672 RepID=UPI0004293C95|nr:flagellar hook-length control protein FliK [Butyrivibrio sp. AC2005]
MITNAIPGINNLDFFANTVQSKGIAATKEQTTDFQKALTNANTQKQTASVSLSVSKTLTTTGALNDTNAAASYTKTKDVQAVQKTDDGKVTEVTTDKAATTENVTNEKVSEKKANTGEAVNENAETADITEETQEVQEAVVLINVNPDGEAAVEEVVDEGLSELEQALLESSRDLMQQLADSMGVDIEDIENAMETLGLTNVAILDPTNLTQIVAQITGADDVMAIVTNADVYLNVQNMQDAVDTTRHNLMEEFNLTEEGLSSALENFNEELEQRAAASIARPEENPVVVEHVEVNEQAAFSSEAARLDLNGEGTVKEVSTQSDLYTEAGTEVQTGIHTELRIEEEPQTQPENNNVEIEEPEFQFEVKPQEQPKEEKHEEQPQQENTEGSQYNHLMNQISSSLSEVVEEPESYGQMAKANTQDIMDQITEYIKMNVKPESTTMEMQLHPASLGNVNVIIEAAKDGNIVAKFLTQNEDVRAAIESQLQQLQEKLNEQGVKVTAVEVTVNTGAFDQALNDSQSQKEEDQEAQDSIRKPMRRIRLEDLSVDALEEIDEEDRLTAEMMAINGNSVDFSA